jgi:RNA polymerase sigma-70 factor (ECF subfamily)
MTASLNRVAQAAAGDLIEPDGTVVPESAQELLQAVWEEAVGQLARLVGAMGVGQGRGEDVLQDVYLAAWQNGPADAGAVELRRWLVRVTVNRCNLEQRRRGRWRAVWQRLADRWAGCDCDGSEAAASQAEEREMVRRALARLAPQVRSLLVLRYFAEFDSAEIGKILEQPDSTVRGQLRHARRQLAWELTQAGYRHE